LELRVGAMLVGSAYSSKHGIFEPCPSTRRRMRTMAGFAIAKEAPVPAQILLVDDDASLGELISEYAAYEAYAVATARTGEEGLRILGQKTFALVILDVMLPGIDGFEVLGQLRHFSDVPVLMLTTRGTAADRIRGLKMGADDYLPKPFEPNELIARVSSILRRIQPSRAGLCFLSVGDVELDARSRRVTSARTAVDLTGAEFSLLQILLSKPGIIFARQDLIPQVLGRPEYAGDRAIDSLVTNLRKKLGPLGNGSERIRSVRGVGYVYVAEEPEKAL
jgi:two-component system, OmpR family, response regulator CpxR